MRSFVNQLEMGNVNGINMNCKLLICGGSNDKSWLKNLDVYESKKIRIKIVRVIYTYFVISRLIKGFRPDLVICLSSTPCFITHLYRKIYRAKFPIISWMQYSLDYKEIMKKLLKYADYHFAISTGIEKQLKSLGILESNIYKIYNPVSRSEKIINRPKGRTVFLYVGRIIFEGQKRIKDLLDALSKVKGEWVLILIGGGPDKVVCQSYAYHLGISNKLIWHGWVNNPWESLDEVTSLVLTSSFEGFGMVLAEAISRGVYCISSDCEAGPKDIIRSGINGELYKTGNTTELACILQKIINGQHLPDHVIIKESIDHLYMDKYRIRISEAMNDIDTSWRRKFL
ncbi:glycosyltransferase [Sporolactobacillus vineae]|uniref:glycosyltransferase n=1 Tax=Sporolactobacillus vineae TaxID=444463 RepID=UPI000287F4D9|nr:glycosyltransferase [Sporolactobacillus vineae]